MQLSWAEDTKNPNCWTVVYKWTIVSHLKSSFYRLLHLLFMIRVYSSQLVSSEKTQPFGKSCSRLSFLCVSLSVSVCQSDHYSRWQITGEQRSPAAPRPVWSRLPRFTYVPATGLKSSDGIAANKETRLSVCHQRTRAKKCGLGFFSLGLKCRCEQKDTLDPVTIIKLQSVKPERRVYLSRPPKAQRAFEQILLDHHCGHKWKSGERCGL